jgi:hypothetical protein
MRVLMQLGDVFRRCPDLADLPPETDEFDQDEAGEAA